MLTLDQFINKYRVIMSPENIKILTHCYNNDRDKFELLTSLFDQNPELPDWLAQSTKPNYLYDMIQNLDYNRLDGLELLNGIMEDFNKEKNN